MDQTTVSTTAIPGLLVIRVPLHRDPRGWFKENWHRQKMVDLGLPDFGPVQHNMSHNTTRGVTRGFHAEPWDKLVSVAQGRVFGAWVDLRAGETFGRTVAVEIDAGTAVFVPRGVGNSYQALEDGTTYSYLVNQHWSPEARSRYTYLNLADETVAVEWPIPLAEAILSQADQEHPRLADVIPFAPGRVVVTGAGGQLGNALRTVFPAADFLGRAELDITDADAVDSFDFDGVELLVNAAAWTAVDAAETRRREAWEVNVTGTAHLVEAARRHRLTLVHISSDYVFDGTLEAHPEDEPLSPLGFYGATKAASEAVVKTWARHYLLRTSWVVGSGRNFVRTMASLAARGVSPQVVDDQHGRLTFADDLAAAIAHLVRTTAPHGTYHVTNDGPALTWFDIARRTFDLLRASGTVSPTSTQDYGRGKQLAARPQHSTLALEKIKSTGFIPPDADWRLAEYLRNLSNPDIPPADA